MGLGGVVAEAKGKWVSPKDRSANVCVLHFITCQWLIPQFLPFLLSVTYCSSVFYIFVLPLSMTKHSLSLIHIYTQQEVVAVWQTYFRHKVVISALSIMSTTHMPLSHKKDQGQKYILILVLTSFSPPSQRGVHTHPAKCFSLLKRFFTALMLILPEWWVRVGDMTCVIPTFVPVTLKVAAKFVD